jgi:hypothetical protein
MLFEAASYHLVTPALAHSLRGHSGVPRKAADYLEGVLYLNGARNRALSSGLTAPLQALNAAGIEPILLKGMASIASDLYPDPAMRILGDVDLLVGEQDGEKAAHVLASLGFEPYRRKDRDYSQHHHLAPQRHPKTGLLIEVHRRPVARPWDATLDGRSVREHARRMRFQGCSAFVPSPTHRVIHNIVHSQLSQSSYARHQLDLRQLLELAALAQQHAAEIDWTVVATAFASSDQFPMFEDTLDTVRSLLGVPIGNRLSTASPRSLRTLQREADRPDVIWLLGKYARNIRKKPGASLRALRRPRSWGRSWSRMLKAIQSDLRTERW